MIDETLLEAEEKMEKAVAVAQGRLRRDPHRPGQPGDVQQDRGRLLRHADAGQPAGVVPRPRARGWRHLTPYDKSAMAAIEKAIRDSDLGVNPTNDGDDHPRGLPAADRGAPQGVHQGRPEQGRGRPGLGPQRPPARQGRARPVVKDGEAGEDDVTRAEKELEESPRSTSPRSTSCSSTRKPSSSRSEARLPDHPMTTDPEDGSSPARARPDAGGAAAGASHPRRANLPVAIGVGVGLGALILALALRLEARVPRRRGRGHRARALGADQRASAPAGSGCPSCRWPSAASRCSSPPTPAAPRPMVVALRADRARHAASGGCRRARTATCGT